MVWLVPWPFTRHRGRSITVCTSALWLASWQEPRPLGRAVRAAVPPAQPPTLSLPPPGASGFALVSLLYLSTQLTTLSKPFFRPFVVVKAVDTVQRAVQGHLVPMYGANMQHAACTVRTVPYGTRCLMGGAPWSFRIWFGTRCHTRCHTRHAKGIHHCSCARACTVRHLASAHARTCGGAVCSSLVSWWSKGGTSWFGSPPPPSPG